VDEVELVGVVVHAEGEDQQEEQAVALEKAVMALEKVVIEIKM
jgi:hypothetical protein